MNRRNFFKVVTGFVAGVFALPTKSKAKDKLMCGRDEIVNEFLLSSDTHLMFTEKIEQFRIEVASAEYCKAHPFCRGCHFNGKKCLLHEIDWDVFQKVMLKDI